MIEIERKFLVLPRRLEFAGREGQEIVQWYIIRSAGRSLRVRRKEGRHILTLKVGKGAVRQEIERDLTDEEAEGLIATALEAPIVKRRYKIPAGSHIWDVDVFGGENEGLILAEVELKDADEFVSHPEWLGLEVTGDVRFQNANLAEIPVSQWSADYEKMLQS